MSRGLIDTCIPSLCPIALLEMSGENSLNLNELFLDACKAGGETKVSAAIVLGVDVNTKDAVGGTGLMWAIEKKHENVVDILLAHPAININGKDNDGTSSLWLAARWGLTSVLVKLGRMPLLRGVNDHGGKAGLTPLSCATFHGKEGYPS